MYIYIYVCLYICINWKLSWGPILYAPNGYFASFPSLQSTDFSTSMFIVANLWYSTPPPQKRWLLYRICSYVLEHITVYNCGQSLIVQNNLLLLMIIFHWCPKEKGLPLCIQVWGYNNASKVLPSTVITLNFLVERSQIRIKFLQKYNGVNIQDWRCEEYLK